MHVEQPSDTPEHRSATLDFAAVRHNRFIGEHPEGSIRNTASSELVGATETEFREVALNVERPGGLVGEMPAACLEQAQGIEQINRAVSEMDRLVQRNAAAAQESASAAGQMDAQARHMIPSCAQDNIIPFAQGIEGQLVLRYLSRNSTHFISTVSYPTLCHANAGLISLSTNVL